MAATAPILTDQIGYHGIVKIGTKIVLATGGNLSLATTPLYTTGIWGAGYKNAVQKIAYAPNYVTLDSSVNFELASGFADALESNAFQNRGSAASYTICPNGVAGYSGNSAFITGCSFSVSQDAIVTGDFNLKTGDVNHFLASNSSNSSFLLLGAGGGAISSISSSYLDVYPFWASSVILQNNQDTARGSASTLTVSSSTTSFSSTTTDAWMPQTTDWNANYSSDLVFINTCRGISQNSNLTQNSTLMARYCAIAPMQASGSFTVFALSDMLNPFNFRQLRKCNINMQRCDGDTDSTIRLLFGSIALNSGSTDVQTGTSFIQTSFNFDALGDGQQCPMMMQFGNKS